MSADGSSTLSRRAFLRAGSLAAGLSACEFPLAQAQSQTHGKARRCIMLLLVGGPSQLETWDPKPGAPSAVRGPFAPIATSVPGIHISEHFPRMASLAERYAVLRTVHHLESPVHEAGLQLLQTGRISPLHDEFPHLGSVLAQARGGRSSFVILPERLGNLGINVGHGQGAGFLGAGFEPEVHARLTHLLDPLERARYGKTAFGDACLHARRLVEQGEYCVVVNMFRTVYDRVTWDCHAASQGLTSTLGDYRRTLCPTFDCAYAALVEDLHQRGLLDETVVVAAGEFGRTPRLNEQGGRDHWPGCWSVVMAGGGVRGGQVIGVSDAHGAEPVQRPIACAEVTASLYHALGVPPATRIIGADGQHRPLTDAEPIHELFR